MPSKQTRWQDRPRWQRLTVEALLAVVFLVGLSQWLTRHMLASDQALPNLPLQSLDGPRTTLHQQLAPESLTLVYAFAPWCGVCQVSMPGLTLATGDHTRVIAIGLSWQSESEVAEMVQDINFRPKVLLGSEQSQRQLAINGYPSYYIVEPDGTILSADRGLTSPPGLWLRLRWLQWRLWLREA